MLDWIESMTWTPGANSAGQTQDTGFVTQGIRSGTRVASNLGWRSVEALSPGDKVLTFDHGMRKVLEVRRQVAWNDAWDVPGEHWQMHVPAGVLGNRVPLQLMPDQGVLIESDEADARYGDPFAVVPARALEGMCGVVRAAPTYGEEIITLIFEDDEVVYAEGGMLIHCPQFSGYLTDQATETPHYPMHGGADAVDLVGGMVIDDPITGKKVTASNAQAWAA